jgi:hypothetical protein
VTGDAQVKSVGVKVYSVVTALFMFGLHAPEIPLLELVGKVKLVPAQKGPIGLKVGVV